MDFSFPAAGASITKEALSVTASQTSWPSCRLSPNFACQQAIVALVIPSPNSGNMILVIKTFLKLFNDLVFHIFHRYGAALQFLHRGHAHIKAARLDQVKKR